MDGPCAGAPLGQIKTAAGHTKDQLMRNRRGEIVSMKANAVRRKLFEKSKIKVWIECVAAARKAPSLKGLVVLNGWQIEAKQKANERFRRRRLDCPSQTS